VGRTENEGRSICIHKNSSGFNGPRASVCASNVHSDSYSMDTACISWNSKATTRLHVFLMLRIWIDVRTFLHMLPWRPRCLFIIFMCNALPPLDCSYWLILWLLESRYQLTRRIFTALCLSVCTVIFHSLLHIRRDLPSHFRFSAWIFSLISTVNCCHSGA
jgi:hypothetical protein